MEFTEEEMAARRLTNAYRARYGRVDGIVERWAIKALERVKGGVTTLDQELSRVNRRR